MPPILCQVKTQRKKLVKFMSFRDGVPYEINHTFTAAALRLVSPAEIRRWMCVKAFGVPDPRIDSKPICKASKLVELQKALSHFMPHKDPTHSEEVERLIAYVKFRQNDGPTGTEDPKSAATKEKGEAARLIRKLASLEKAAAQERGLLDQASKALVKENELLHAEITRLEKAVGNVWREAHSGIARRLQKHRNRPIKCILTYELSKHSGKVQTHYQEQYIDLKQKDDA